jgi:hypothetical protein
MVHPLDPAWPVLCWSNAKQSLKQVQTKGCIKRAKDIHALYIDDLSEAEAIDLTKRIVDDPIQRPFPLNFHEQTQHVLPAGSTLHQNLYRVEEFSATNKMKINETKSKVMILNKSRNNDFPPEFKFINGDLLECLESTTFLGIYITSDLRWKENCSQIYMRAMAKIWLLRRLKK